MAESVDLCARYKFHKQKIYYTFSSMRHYCEELKEKNYKVHYEKFDPEKKSKYFSMLSAYIKKHKVTQISLFEPADLFMSEALRKFTKKEEVELVLLKSPMFIRDSEWFAGYMKGKKKPFMKSFYETIRKESGILMDPNGKAMGGKFSFDSDNRKKLPKDVEVPKVSSIKVDELDREVAELVKSNFQKHPGQLEDLWIPTTREEAKKRWNNFKRNKLKNFGDYQDALKADDSFLFHSLISPSVNAGHLLVEELVADVEKELQNGNIPINSAEGFIRQIIGWREFVHLVYENYNEELYKGNFFKHKRKMKKSWYDGSLGIPPLDNAIKQADRFGYCHHIERLMVLANFMNLSGIEPKEVYDWFMEMFIDSADWVMAANVFGMGLMSDGGIFATKPYISGSNYICKMSHYKKGEWCDVWDGLYWRFVENNFKYLTNNPRLAMTVRTLDKMKPERKEKIYSAADKFLEEHTYID